MNPAEPTAMAILRDDRDLLWLALSLVECTEEDLVFDVHLLARDEPGESPVPFVTACGYREPLVGIRALLEDLAGAVRGDVTALRHDPISDGLSIELKAQGAPDLGFEVVLWLDLTRMGRAMRARASRGRHQGGLRFFCDRTALEAFRADLASFLVGQHALQ